MKKSITILCLLLVGLLSFAAIQPLSGIFVSASVAPVVFCPNNFQQGTDTQYEIWVSEATCGYIVSMLASRYYPVGCYYSFNDDCTNYHYLDLLDWLQYYYDQSVVFSKGHRNIPYSNPLHISLLDHDGYDIIDNYYGDDIYDVTSSENVFTFIWHCQTAQYYSKPIVPDGNGHYHGMPFCWTHNDDLDCWGDSGTQVYLGWAEGSPQFEYTANYPYNYAHVAYYFWYYMCDGATVEEALNDIAVGIFGDESYLQSPLCDWLIVWGDRTSTLP